MGDLLATGRHQHKLHVGVWCPGVGHVPEIITVPVNNRISGYYIQFYFFSIENVSSSEEELF